MAASDELDVVNETSLERTREREIREKDEEIASLRAQIESMQSPPNVLPSDKPGRMYQVFGSGFAYAFATPGLAAAPETVWRSMATPLPSSLAASRAAKLASASAACSASWRDWTRP